MSARGLKTYIFGNTPLRPDPTGFWPDFREDDEPASMTEARSLWTAVHPV